MGNLRLSLDHIAVVDGKRQEIARHRGGGTTRSAGPGLFVVEPSTRFGSRPKKGRLIILAEPDLPGGIPAAPAAAELIAKEFYNDTSPSIVSSLSRALRNTHRQLLQANLQALSSDRRSVSVACAAVRDDDIYIAQVGPSLALRVRNGQLAALGRTPSAEPISFSCAMGQDCEIDIVFCHETLQPNDAILLCSDKLLSALGRETVARLLQAADSAEIINSLHRVCVDHLKLETFAAVAVVAISATHKSLRNGFSPGREATPTPDRASRHVLQVAEDDPPRIRQAEQSQPHTKMRARAVAREKKTENQADRAAIRTRRHVQPSRIVIFGILPLVLLAAVLLIVVGLLERNAVEQNKAQAAKAHQAAEKILAEALATQDLKAKRQLLQEAEKLAAQSLVTKLEENGAAMGTRDRIRRELDQLSATKRVTSPRLLVDLSQESRIADPTRLLLQGIDLYILDKGNNRIYKYLLDQNGDQLQTNSNPIIVRVGDRVGGRPVGRLITMAWVPPGGQRLQGALVFLDDDGNLYAYEPARGLSALGAIRSFAPEQIKALGGYAGSLYVLAPTQNKLWWLAPAAEGYENEPYSYISPDASIDLSSAVDFAVGSSVFILQSTGKVVRLHAGRPQKFDGTVVDLPIRSPSAIYVPSETSSVYVVDTGNQRIVQFNRDGHFEQQIRYGGADNAFGNLKGIAINEERGKLYLLNDKQVLVTDVGK